MPKPKRFYRYRITHVWGSMQGHLEVGATLIERYHGKSHDWQIWQASVGDVTGGYSGELIGEVTETEVLMQLTGKRT